MMKAQMMRRAGHVACMMKDFGGKARRKEEDPEVGGSII
jgi:hypothetical protein